MEPMNCVARIGDGTCEIWNGAQNHTSDQQAVGALLAIPPEGVTIHTLFAGGGFGRRATPPADYVIDVVAIAKAARTAAPYATGCPVTLASTCSSAARMPIVSR